MTNMKKLQLLLLGMLLSMPMVMHADGDELNVYCYGQVTASTVKGQSDRGKVCASKSETAPATPSDNQWNTSNVKDMQIVNVGTIGDVISAAEVELQIWSNATPLYVHALLEKDGYYFEGWKDKNDNIVTTETTYAVRSGWNIRANAYEAGKEVYSEMGPYYASFPNLEIGEPTGAVVIHPTHTGVTMNNVITIPVPHADSKNDIEVVPVDGTNVIESLTGNGGWESTSWTCSKNGVVTITYNFDGNGSTGVSTGQIIVRSKGGESQRIIKLQAHYANIASGDAPLVVCAPGASVTGTATFATQYVKNVADDFLTPAFSNATGGTWTVTDTTYSNNQLKVNYSFAASSIEGTYTAELQLETSAGVSKAVVCTVVVENPADVDALVLDAAGNDLTGGGLSLAEAISFANVTADADTISLRRDVTIAGTLPPICKSLVFDLRGKTITDNGSETIDFNEMPMSPTLMVGYDNFAPNVTLTDSRVNGTIYHEASVAGALITVAVLAGKLTVPAGVISSRNTLSYPGVMSIALAIVDGAECELKGSCALQSSAVWNYAIGVENMGTLTIQNCQIEAHANNEVAVAIDVLKEATINGGTYRTIADNATSIGLYTGPVASLQINGGVVYANSVENTIAINSEGTTIVNGGEFFASSTGAKAVGLVQNASKGNTSSIIGGRFMAEAADASTMADVLISIDEEDDNPSGGISITGGIYSSIANSNAFAGVKFRNLNPASADYAAGYRYTVGNSPNAAVAKIGDMYFPSLASALSYVNNNPSLNSTIVLLDDDNLPAGKYTLPAKATLLIPYKAEQETIKEHPERRPTDKNDKREYVTPSCFRKLTLENGARLDIFGKVQTGGVQIAKEQIGGTNGVPTDAYGMIYMEEGSSMTVEGGAHLYSWGYICGRGTIDVKRGGTVHEMMQIMDWRGGSATFAMNENSQKVFPLNQYYIQNIEVPTTYRPGAKELIDGVVNAYSQSIGFDDVLLIGGQGTKCMFTMDTLDMSEDTWVRKWYDAEHDKQVYDINNSAQISTLVLTLNVLNILTVSFNSSLYVLPLTNNMKIHLLTGTLGITQDVLLTPGAEIEVDKEATAYITEGKKLFVMDADEWESFAAGRNIYPLPYSPSWTSGCPRSSSDALADATINVHGTFRVDGYVYTTAHGANIFSTNADAGTFLFNNDAPMESSVVYLSVSSGSEITYNDKISYSAWLRNGDATFAHTAGAESGRTYAYYDNHWRNWRTEECFAVETTAEEEEIYYAKPADYVALAAGEPNAADHLYHSADLTRAFILMEDAEGCQWWEVTKVDNEDDLYYCAKNNVYYFYDEAGEVPQWKEKVLTVRWLDSDGETLLHEYTNVHYGDKAQYFHDDPVKPADGYKTYDFIGWLPTPAEHLTSDASYVAQYQENVKECTITFRDANGDLIEQNQVAIGAIPVCSGAPAGIGELYDWYPPIHAVTADEEYMLVAREIKQYYELTFLDWDNTMLLNVPDVPAGKTISVAADAGGDYYLTIEDEANPVPFDANPNKPGNNGREYTLTGWSPTLTAVDGDAIYTAVYEESLQKFAITLNASDGGSLTANISGTGAGGNEYEYGTQLTLTATPSTGYYLQKWQDNLVAPSRTITVTDTATYTATFSNEYKVVLRTNGGSILANGRSTYTYDAVNATPLPAANELRHDTDETRTALGWYAKADFSDQATWAIPAGTAKNLVYYLKWSDPVPEGEVFVNQTGRTDPSGSGYYATFYSSTSNYIVPDGYTAYKAVIVGERIHLEAIGGIIPAGEGVLLHSETENMFDLAPTAEDAWEIGQNDFTGTDVQLRYADITGGTPYVFSAVNGVIGFYKLSSTASIPAHRAYVLWTSGQSAPPRMLRIDRSNVTTDITAIETAEPVKQLGIFSILGHELAEPIHGTINIIDGELKYIP